MRIFSAIPLRKDPLRQARNVAYLSRLMCLGRKIWISSFSAERKSINLKPVHGWRILAFRLLPLEREWHKRGKIEISKSKESDQWTARRHSGLNLLPKRAYFSYLETWRRWLRKPRNNPWPAWQSWFESFVSWALITSFNNNFEGLEAHYFVRGLIANDVKRRLWHAQSFQKIYSLACLEGP